MKIAIEVVLRVMSNGTTGLLITQIFYANLSQIREIGLYEDNMLSIDQGLWENSRVPCGDYTGTDCQIVN